MPRHVVWFSCGAPSAVAAKLTVQEFPDAVVAYCDTGGEHPDSLRFLADVERWIGVPVIVLKSEKYSDHFDVARKKRYVNGPHGAACTGALKREVREAFQRPGDVHVWGFTAEERDRRIDFEDAFPSLACAWPLIDAGLYREDCHGIIQRAGIRRHAMYEMGYHNANCIGCWKGKQGYWNKIRRDFPAVFAEAAAICREIGRSPIAVNGVPLMLDDLPEGAGRYKDEPAVECGIGCHVVDAEIKDRDAI